MPTIRTRDMHQAATYWPPGAPDGSGGLVYTDPPVPVICRWQDQAVLFRSSTGREMTSSAVVYVGLRVLPEGYIALGTSVETDPRGLPGARIIMQVGSSPSLSTDEELIKVWL